jgi:integrase
VLSPEEILRLIQAAASLIHRTILILLYATGIRRAELRWLQVSDIDSQRMVIRIQQGKGRRERDIPMTPHRFTFLAGALPIEICRFRGNFKTKRHFTIFALH